MRLTRPVRFYDKIRDWGPWSNNYGENWQRKAAAFNTNFATNKSGVGGVADVLNPMVGENKWNRDPSNFTPDCKHNTSLLSCSIVSSNPLFQLLSIIAWMDGSIELTALVNRFFVCQRKSTQ